MGLNNVSLIKTMIINLSAISLLFPSLCSCCFCHVHWLLEPATWIVKVLEGEAEGQGERLEEEAKEKVEDME
jgi:hypothetical protein